jgi:uncharacterized OB-fold protein
LGFERFGRFGYVSQTKINPLLSYLEKGQIAATKCKKCGRTYFPPRVDCLDCRHSAIEWVVLDGKANLITFTEVFFAPPAFQPETPYLLGLAELTNGLRAFAPISPAVDKGQLKPGLELNLKVAKGSRDNLYYWLE